MRINSPEYRVWLRHRNEKNLRRRTKKRKAQQKAVSKIVAYNRNIKNTAEYNSKSNSFVFEAPLVFSFIENPTETIAFFDRVISFITDKRNFKRNLFFDISRITTLTTDALMYLLAIVNNLESNFQNKYRFSGNEPRDAAVKKLFTESGFYQFVRRRSSQPLTLENDNIQIISGENCDTTLAKKVSDYVCSKAGVGKRACSFLYNMMIELMSNSHKHAYNNPRNILHQRWYCFVEYDKDDLLTFTFMDTGEGIPATVRRNFVERLDVLGLKSETSYVISALKGEFRTATKKDFRGKGLPKIYEFCQDEKISKLHIVTNKADILVNQSNFTPKEIGTPLRGTLYTWQISIKQIRRSA